MGMSYGKSWARSLHYRVIKHNGEVCGWSEEFQTTIHRFNTGERVCRCGKQVVEEKITSGGWKRTPINGNSSDKTKASGKPKTKHG